MNRPFFLNHYPLSKIIFFLLVLFIPQQFGPHFWPEFSYVHGIRVDYLSPAIYISTILLGLLMAVSYKAVLQNVQTVSFFKNTKVLVFLTLLVIPLLYAYSIPALYFGLLKFACLLYLGLYAATQIQRKDIPVIISLFIVSALGESFLSILQFINQGSINGAFYFLGERLYSASSLNIALINSQHGLLVRPYGTFPHPNVLAYYLFVTSILALYIIPHLTTNRKLIALLCLLIMQLALFLTFSRVIIFLNVLLFLSVFIHNKRKYFKTSTLLFLIAGVCFSFYIIVFNLRFLNFSNILQDTLSRLEALPVVLSSILSYPLGLGLSNFFYYQGSQQTIFSSMYLQPIHNIFLLLVAEVGIPCTLLFVYFLGLTLAMLWKSLKIQNDLFYTLPLFIILITSIVAGMFDHYLMTVWQGQLLFALVLGLCWNKKIKKTKE